MTLALLLTRRTDLRLLLPVAWAAHRRKHQVVFVLQPRAAKRGDALDVKEVLRLGPPATLTGEIPRAAAALVARDGALPDVSIPRIGVAQWYDDLWLRPMRGGPGYTACYISDYQLDKHMALYRQVADASYPPAVVGWLPGDFATKIPAMARDSAVLFSLKLGVEPWRDSREGRAFYEAIVRAARDRAHAEGLKFLVKTRGKNHDPWWLRWMADEVIGDRHPWTSLALLARAKWCVHFESGAGLEAALMGAFSYAVQIPQSHITDLPGGRLQYGSVAMHCWPGVAAYWNPLYPGFVNDAQRQKYLETYLGPGDGRAGERVVDVAEGK